VAAAAFALLLVGASAISATSQDQAAPNGPAGVWRFDPVALKHLADAIGEAMASDLKPDQRRAAAVRLKEMEARYASLARTDPPAAQAMEAELRAARATTRALERDPAAFFGDRFLARLGDPAQALITLGSGGELIYEGVVDRRRAAGGGAWRREDGEVILATTLPGEPADTGELLVLRGRLEEQRLVLRYELDPDDKAELRDKPALSRAMRDAPWVLVRQ
jgi:hypothetical protein